MAPTRVVAIADAVHTAGDYTSAVFDVPQTTTRIGAAIERKNWNATENQDAVRLIVEVSRNGTVWTDAGQVIAKGGTSTDRLGNTQPETVMVQRLPKPEQQQLLTARVQFRAMRRVEGTISLIFDDAPLPPTGQAHHSVTYAADSEATATAATSVTISSFTVASNTNRALFIGVASWDATVGDSAVSGVTWNGSATGAAAVGTHESDTNRATIWRVINPTATTANVVVSMGGNCSEIGANVLSVYDVHQTTPAGTMATSNINNVSGTQTVTVNVSAATDDLVYDVVMCNPSGASPINVGASQTQRANSTIVSGSNLLVSTEPGATTVTMSWQLVAGGPGMYAAQAAVAIKVAAAAADTSLVWGRPPMRALLVR